MKNQLFTIVLLITTSLSFSQSKTTFGIKGGANVSNISSAGLDSKTNGYFGAFFNVHVSDVYEFQPELVYSNQGGTYKFNNDQSIYVEYISIGVANKFFVDGSNGFHIIIVPTLDFDIDDTLIGLINRNGDYGNDATFIDLTIGAGFGYEFSNGLTIEARYKRGLIDVYSGEFHDFESERYENEVQLNSVFQIGIVYKFNFSK
jgi:hypothetical protein